MGRAGLNRREALGRLAAGGIGVAASITWVETLSARAREQAAHTHAVLASAAQAPAGWAPKVLNGHQLATVATLSELVIPETNTPGARAALVDRFIDQTLRAAPRPDRTRFLSGLAWIDARSRTLFAKDFVSASAPQQTELLTRLSAETPSEDRAGVEFFNAVKSMTITGYYTSEIGLSQELGDDGRLVLAEFTGCTHQEHQR